EALLMLGFNKPVDRGAAFGKLSVRQQHVLKLLAEATHFWGIWSGKDFMQDVDASNLLRMFNLPDRQDSLRAYIRGEDASKVPPPKAVGSGGIMARLKRLFRK